MTSAVVCLSPRFWRCQSNLKFLRTIITAIFGTPPRTVARRKEARHLNPQESDRLFGTRQVEEVLLCLNYGIFS